MRTPLARSATIEPMLPQPIRPRVLPASSTPTKRFFSHLPLCVDRSAWGISRASANSIAIACSAVVIEFPNGVFITTIPRALAAGTSIVSTPIPARPMTCSRGSPASIAPALTLVELRTARPSYSPMMALSSSGVSPGFSSAEIPRSRKIVTARESIVSAIKTLTGSATNYLPRPVEPRPERLDVGGVDRRPAPHSNSRRGVTISTDVVRHPLLLEQPRKSLLPQLVRFDVGAVGELQANRRVGADRRIRCQMFDPGGL